MAVVCVACRRAIAGACFECVACHNWLDEECFSSLTQLRHSSCPNAGCRDFNVRFRYRAVTPTGEISNTTRPAARTARMRLEYIIAIASCGLLLLLFIGIGGYLVLAPQTAPPSQSYCLKTATTVPSHNVVNQPFSHYESEWLQEKQLTELRKFFFSSRFFMNEEAKVSTHQESPHTPTASSLDIMGQSSSFSLVPSAQTLEKFTQRKE